MQNVLTVTVCDAAHRAHRAGNHHHRVRRIGAAGERGVHALERVGSGAVGQAQTRGEFLRDDLSGIIAEDDVEFVLARVQVVEQALRVKRAAGSRDGDE